MSKIEPELVTRIATVVQNAELLFDQSFVEDAINKVAVAVASEIQALNPLILCVMNGGLVFTAALMQRWDFAAEFDYVHATRYGNGTVGGQLVYKVLPPDEVRNRHVVIVDDIFDAGDTLQSICAKCFDAGAASVRSVVLVTKSRQRSVAEPDFSALSVPDRYVFGYGMDYQGYCRNLQGIYALSE